VARTAAKPSVASRSGPPPGVTPEAAATARALLSLQPVDSPQQTAPGSWFVQVSATREATSAEQLASKLRERGYKARVVPQARGNETWYQVRVGRFGSIDKANALVSRLRDREGLPSAFVASD
jgi:cell division septation protein DedD